MDNVTHTLYGVVLARALPSFLKFDGKNTPGIASAYLWTSLIASNLPDGDILQTLFGDRTNYGYLLHHRGYTHTFLMAVPLGLIAAAGVCAFTRIRLTSRLAAVGVIASLLHLAADYMNDYGVHLFSPFMNGWFYGDQIFIVEPYLWFSMLPFAFYQVQNKYFKVLWVILGVTMLGLLWEGSFASKGVSLGVTLWGFVMVWLQRHRDPARALRVVMASVIIVLSSFAVSSYAVKNRVQDYARRLSPAETLMDIVTTPAPGNPFCWRVWMLTDEDGVTYVSRLAIASLLPSLVSPVSCYRGLDTARTVQLIPPTIESDVRVIWKGEYRLDKQAFELLEERYCDFRRYLRFSRLPYVQVQEGKLIAGDLRYDREPGLGFSEVVLDEKTPQHCLEGGPPWAPPFPRKLSP